MATLDSRGNPARCLFCRCYRNVLGEWKRRFGYCAVTESVVPNSKIPNVEVRRESTSADCRLDVSPHETRLHPLARMLSRYSPDTLDE